MNNTAIVRRLCKGGCGQWFTPPPSRPGQEYVHGHKNGCAAAADHSKPSDHDEAARRILDYRMALASVRRELADVEQQIDKTDDAIELLRRELHAQDSQKEKLTERHLNLSSSAMALEALTTGKSLVRQIAVAEAAQREAGYDRNQ
jgi:chromosome segregation ATPase